MMMMMGEEFQDRNNLSLDDIDLSLLRLTSPPYNYSPSTVSDEISPLKRSSPVSDESDQSKRRKTQYPNIAAGQTHCSHASAVSEKQETTPSSFKTPTLETMKMVNNRVEEINCKETNYDYELKKQREKEEEDCGEGMRIERSGDGFVIRLKCKCRQAFRVLFSDHHLYFKPL